MTDTAKLLLPDSGVDIESATRPRGTPECTTDHEELSTSPCEGSDEELAIAHSIAGNVRRISKMTDMDFLQDISVSRSFIGSFVSSRAGLLAVIALVITGVLGLATVLFGLTGKSRLSWRGGGEADHNEVGLEVVPPPATGPSLFCFSVMQPKTDEQTLIEYQIKRRMSIFACDEFAVISTKKMTLSKGNGDVTTWYNPATAVTIGDMTKAGVTTNSWLNTATFIEAYDTLVKSKLIFKHDFLVKADPDAVFFPDRLRMHLVPHVGKTAYVANCNHFRGQDPVGPKVFGSLEIYTKAAMRVFEDGAATCKNRAWHGWGEDYYMQTCMNMLGVSMVTDFNLIGDNRCTYAPCTDATRVAYHPFKDLASYKACFKHAIGEIA